MRILLVEDEPRMAQVVAKGLREHAYAVDVAGDGDSALYQSAINDYDLILLDVLLPNRDGFEVCRELRARGDATRLRSEEHTSELQSPDHLVCRLLLEKKKQKNTTPGSVNYHVCH